MPTDVFAARLRSERDRLGISQADLARRMSALLGHNVEPTAITRMEHRTRAVRLDEAVAAAEALGAPLTALLHEDPAAETDREIRQCLQDLSAAESRVAEARAEVEQLTELVRRLQDQRRGLSG